MRIGRSQRVYIATTNDEEPPAASEESNGIVASGPSTAAIQDTSRKTERRSSRWHRGGSPDYYVAISPRGFRLWWWFSLMHHTASVLFTVIAGVAHVFIGDVKVYENMWLLAIPRKILVVTGWTYLVIGLAHATAMVKAIVYSISYGHLTFGNESDPRPRAKQSPSTFASTTPRFIVRFNQFIQTLSERFTNSVLGSIFHIQGKYFDTGFHVRQLVEVLLQIYQARSLSRSVPNPSLNHIVVSLVIINCVYTPIVDYMYRHRPQLRRLICLWVDLVVDFIIAVIIPMWVLVAMLWQFDFAVGRFPSRLTIDDIWITNSISDGRQALVTSELDYVSSIFPHILGLLGIDSIKAILRVQREPSVRSETELWVTLSRPTPTDRPLNRRRRGAIAKRISVSFLSMFVDRVQLFFALMVIIFHVGAQSRSAAVRDGCAVLTRTWVPSGHACAVFNLNCNRIGRQGDSNDVEAELATLDRKTLTKLILSHCPALEMPPIVTQFKHLRTIEMYNCTIAQWNETAAVTYETNPTLVQVQLVHTNFSDPGLPSGLTHSLIPVGLNLIVHGSNLSVLPGEIDVIWGRHHWSALWFEYTSISRLPRGFQRLQITKLSLLGNQITVLDDDLFRFNSPAWMRVSENPLTTLPSEFRDTESLSQVFAEHTQIAELPEWLATWWKSSPPKSVHGQPILLLRGSPYCNLTLDDAEAKRSNCDDIDPRIRDDIRVDLLPRQRPL